MTKKDFNEFINMLGRLEPQLRPLCGRISWKDRYKTTFKPKRKPKQTAA